MDPASVEPSAIPFEARISGWLAVAFFVDIANLGREDRPLLDALLINGVMEANLSPLNRDPELQEAHARIDAAPPDALRRPVSINALAGSLRLPFETVRRHINKLVREGALAATPQGVFVPTAWVVSPAFVRIARARYERVIRFYEDLRAAEAVEPLAAPFPSVDDPDAPIRAVGRILSDYVFRTLDPLLQRFGDPLTVMVMLEVVRSSTEHFSTAQAITAMRNGWIPDADRAPARVAHLSRRLGIPYETTRRHVGWLIEQQICRRGDGGVLLSAGYRQRDSLPFVAGDNLINIRRMFRQVAILHAAEAPRLQAAAP